MLALQDQAFIEGTFRLGIRLFTNHHVVEISRVRELLVRLDDGEVALDPVSVCQYRWNFRDDADSFPYVCIGGVVIILGIEQGQRRNGRAEQLDARRLAWKRLENH